MNGLLAGLFIAAFGKDSRLSRILWFAMALSIPLGLISFTAAIVSILAFRQYVHVAFVAEMIFCGIFLSSFVFLLVSAYIRFMIGLFQGIRQAPNRR